VKRGIAGVTLAATLAIAAATTRPLWLAPDAAQAQAWLRDAADRRDAGAEAALARWSARGNAGARHAYAALLAHRPDAASRRRLEQVLADGAGAGDAADATQLAELLARADAQAGRAGGDASGTGAGAQREDARIDRLLAQGSAGHVPAASRLLALRALDAARGTPDPARAAALMARAADGGDVPAMFLYANMLRAGEGVKRDDAKALALYEAAGDADYAPAIQALALAWRYGELGLQADNAQSRLMDHEAAEALAHAAR
jgi:TPR repeat protein